MMKRFFSLLLLAGLLQAADINATLYEGGDKEALYGQVRQQIDAALSRGTLTKPQAEEQRTELDRLRRAAAQTVETESDAAALLPQPHPTLEEGYHALSAAAETSLKQENTQRTLRDIQSKLTFLKQKIEQITAEEKPLLRSYQLQFAYYKVQQNNLETKTEQLRHNGDAIFGALKRRLSELPCPEKELRTALEKSAADIDKSAQRKVAAEITMEGAVLEEDGQSERLKSALDAAKEHYGQQVRTKLETESKLALCMLKGKADKSFFALMDDMDADVSRLAKEQRAQYEAQNAQLRALAKARFGVTTLVVGDTLHETRALLAKAGETLSSPLFVFNERPISFLSLLKALLILIFGFFVGRMYKRWIARMAKRWPDMSQMSVRLASNIGYYFIVIVALIVAVGSLGIDMTSISLIAGALSIGIGFGLQTVVSNLIAGIILMFERTIRIGDMIEISDVLRGRVTDMRIRSTTIKTFDNIDIVVPNSSFIQNNVINWTLEDITRRIHVPFSVAYGTEVEAVKQAILEELAQSELNYIRHDPDKKPEVWMTSMSSSSVDFELLVWVEWANKLRPNALRSDFMILIYNALYRHGIQIPFPQLDLYVKQMPGQQE